MVSRTTAARSTALGIAVLLVAPWQAIAQSGPGLYEPFPEAAVKKRAQRYVEGLSSRTAEPGRRYSDADLARGAFVDPDGGGGALRPASGTDGVLAGERAGAAAKSGVALPLQLALLALLLGGTVAITRGRGQTREA